MKQYVIDEWPPGDRLKLAAYLKDQFYASGVDGVYWAMLGDDLLNDIQKTHDDCGPFYMAIELTESAVICEFLVRAKNNLHCDCICYANQPQREWIMGRMDAMIEILGIQA